METNTMLLNEMEIFYYIVQLQSFSKAADKLEVSKAYISKRLTRLEQALNTRLLTRSTRKLTLTEAGEEFYRFCSTVVREAEQGYASMQDLQTEPSGVLKISAPPAVGLGLLAPVLPIFMQRFPRVKLNIQLEHRVINLVEEGYDLALRAGQLESSNLYAQKILQQVKHYFCATPNYFKKFGFPENPEALKGHNCAIYGYSLQTKSLQLSKNLENYLLPIQGSFCSNQLFFIKQMVMQDLCIGMFPEYMISTELKTKELMVCLSDYELPRMDLYAIYPERELMPLKVKAFIDVLKESLVLN